MLNKQKWLAALIAMTVAPVLSAASIGDGPNKRHIEQADIDAGLYTMDQLIEHGRHILFDPFNEFDGHGDPERPGINSSGVAIGFNRVSGGGDNVSCAHCHTKPMLGGAGDYAQSIFPEFNRPDGVNILGFEGLNTKNSKSMFGIGPKEMLGREMTAEIKSITDAAITQAIYSGTPVTVNITTKGTDFGYVTAFPDGKLDTTAVEGISHDLVVRPFVSVGAFDSLRIIAAGSMEQHFGIEAEELFGLDDDGDGVERELTVGDITAATLFQAALFIPSEVRSRDAIVNAAVDKGRVIFNDIGCADCHTPTMILNNPVYTASAPGSENVISLDLTTQSFRPRLRRLPSGAAPVNLYSDLKRHDMGALMSEPVEETERESHQHYLTMPLWGVANTGPWMHDGRATSLTDAIHWHGGEGTASKNAFNALTQEDQDKVIEFMKSLRIVAKDLKYIISTLPLPGTDNRTDPAAEDTSIGLSEGDSFDVITSGLVEEGAISGE